MDDGLTKPIVVNQIAEVWTRMKMYLRWGEKRTLSSLHCAFDGKTTLQLIGLSMPRPTSGKKRQRYVKELGCVLKLIVTLPKSKNTP